MPDREPSWPMFRRVWRRAELTDRMITEVGVDPIVAARLDRGAAYRNACTKCLTCPLVQVLSGVVQVKINNMVLIVFPVVK